MIQMMFHSELFHKDPQSGSCATLRGVLLTKLPAGGLRVAEADRNHVLNPLSL